MTVYIRQITSAHATPLNYRVHQPAYVTNKVRNMKPTITTTQYG